ncbi:MAG: hypothetical protein NPIRA03_08310 [Nitrospirales bacterium]|nr:MAG: hypothetical protein NPIRA03_08310 [Nitrospirales bacterium]
MGILCGEMPDKAVAQLLSLHEPANTDQDTVIQSLAYGYRHEKYLRLEILSAYLPGKRENFTPINPCGVIEKNARLISMGEDVCSS